MRGLTGRRGACREATGDAVLAVVVLTAGAIQEAVRASAQVLAVQLDALPDEHARTVLADGILARLGTDFETFGERND